jgi:formylglycine-generating enzyme required for sulfatase activity
MTSKQRFAVLSLFGTLLAQSAQAITIDTVPIGNPGNPPDIAVMSTDGTSGYGSVGYNYGIGKYDVTVGQYTAFLNAVAATDTYGLYNPSMATDLNSAGISQSCVAGSCNYSVIGSPNHPVTYVSWGDAARFSNWLNNGQPTGAEGPGTTETGAYTLDGAISDAALNAISRNAGATWFIPSENEWYKAAYYDPNKLGGPGYWNYATGTNTTPASTPPGNLPNTANYGGVGYAVTGAGYDPHQNYLTDVGAYTASGSPYGTFDQSGLVNQWSEAVLDNAHQGRGLRGGAWNGHLGLLPATFRNREFPTVEDDYVGFRVATIPEPSTAVLAVVACGSMLWLRRRYIA